MRNAGNRRDDATAPRHAEGGDVSVDGGLDWSEENFFFALAAGVMLANVICAVVRLVL